MPYVADQDILEKNTMEGPSQAQRLHHPQYDYL